MNYQYLVDAALAAGADKAAVIPQSSIVLSENFYDICATNACGKFGRCWMCPPDVGHITDLMAQVRSYPWALLYQTIRPLEDSFDVEGMDEASKIHARLSQRMQALAMSEMPGRFFHLGGGCNLCERCAKLDNEPCCLPDKALPSMSAAGIDVYNTTRETELKYVNGPNTVTYFGILLFHEVQACPN